jgi:hypothetical protein
MESCTWGNAQELQYSRRRAVTRYTKLVILWPLG